VVTFRDDCETFCKYIAVRPPNVDGTVHLHREDRHLEGAIRGIYYAARYRHQPTDGGEIAVGLDQFCGRLDPDAPDNLEARATARKVAEIERRLHEAVAQVGATVHKGADRYTGEVMPPSG
jgi:hypothetical protein